MTHEERDIDAQLGSPSQEAVRRAVRALPEESVSMAWRSGLNESILAAAAKRTRRARLFRVARPVVGMGLAAALAFVAMLQSPNVGPKAGKDVQLEALMVQEHVQGAQLADVTGVGLTAMEASYRENGPATTDLLDWSEVDIESL